MNIQDQIHEVYLGAFSGGTARTWSDLRAMLTRGHVRVKYTWKDGTLKRIEIGWAQWIVRRSTGERVGWAQHRQSWNDPGSPDHALTVIEVSLHTEGVLRSLTV